MTDWQSLSTTTKGRRMGVLDGKIAIVTGTSRGVGVGIAHELLRAGATVIG
jgi:NADP-dependent 3-hydroxy acid dehydrogenase YdfG